MLRKPPKLAIWKFSSCDGCQLSLLDCEDELLAASNLVEIAYFPEATKAQGSGPYDISLVEGSITTEEEATRIQEIRQKSRWLIAIGACATAGGIQALRNFASLEDYKNLVYAQPEAIHALEKVRPLADLVKVDFSLRGCPISKKQLLALFQHWFFGGRLFVTDQPLCAECKRGLHRCLWVQGGQPCLGPVTQAGCEGLCPGHNRPCFGCYGPKPDANLPALVHAWQERGIPQSQINQLLAGFTALDFLPEGP